MAEQLKYLIIEIPVYITKEPVAYISAYVASEGDCYSEYLYYDTPLQLYDYIQVKLRELVRTMIGAISTEINEDDVKKIAQLFKYDGNIRTVQESNIPIAGQPVYTFYRPKN